MFGGRIASKLTFEIQTFWNKHLNDTTNRLMSPKGSYLEAKNRINSPFVILMFINKTCFFISNIVVIYRAT